ncbi:MAG: DUF6879 family protein [Streptosporangiaceae bacterium]
MTDRSRLAGVDLAQCFDLFEVSAFRLETLRAYAVGGAEEERLRAFRLGLPRPERSARTSPWLARIAQTTAAGKSWRRIRVLGWPLTEYERYQMTGYQESAAAGDVIRVADRSAHPQLAALNRDFWLFDAEGPQPFAALMTYDEAGNYLGSEITTAPGAIEGCKASQSVAGRYAVALKRYLAHLRSEAA